MMRFAVVPVVILGACALASGALLAQGPRNIQPLAIEDRAGFEPMFDGIVAGRVGRRHWFLEGRGRPAGGRVDRGQAAAGQHVPDLDQGAAGRLRAEDGLPHHGRQHRRPVPAASARRTSAPTCSRATRRTSISPTSGPVSSTRSAAAAFLALPGQATFIGGDKPRIFGSATPADALKAAINVGGWNTIHIIARKDLVVHAVNGKVSARCSSTATRRSGRANGFIGLQLHTGPPMRAEFRNVAIKVLK